MNQALLKTTIAPEPEQNHLLSAVDKDVKARIFPYLELVPLPQGEVIYESGDKMGYVYFPSNCVISLLNVMENGSSAEVSIVGNEGVLGVSLFMGCDSTPSRAVVHSAGTAYRLSGSRMKDEFDLHGKLQELMLRYTQSLFIQMAQTAVCNRHHCLEQQLCRWLLLSLDRLSGSDLAITHERIANMLGVRREGITEAAGKLQKLGIIECWRGHIRVVHRPGLEELVCECYAAVKTETDRLLS